MGRVGGGGGRGVYSESAASLPRMLGAVVGSDAVGSAVNSCVTHSSLVSFSSSSRGSSDTPYYAGGTAPYHTAAEKPRAARQARISAAMRGLPGIGPPNRYVATWLDRQMADR